MISDRVLLGEELIQSCSLWLRDTRGHARYFPSPRQADRSLLWLRSGLLEDMLQATDFHPGTPPSSWGRGGFKSHGLSMDNEVMESSGDGGWTPSCVHTQDSQTLTIVLACWFPSLGLCLLILQPLLLLIELQHLWGQCLTRGARKQQQGVVAIVVLQQPQDLCAWRRGTTYSMCFLTSIT